MKYRQRMSVIKQSYNRCLGKSYGRLLVLHVHPMLGNDRKATVLCLCGKTAVKSIKSVVTGRTRSCGCLAREVNTKTMREVGRKYGPKYGVINGKRQKEHGESHSNKTPEYEAWVSMKKRCLNSRHEAYANYGGRGITICARWITSYVNFLADMGRRPSDNYSLDRINNDGNYEPANCRWATAKQQNNNQRKRSTHKSTL